MIYWEDQYPPFFMYGFSSTSKIEWQEFYLPNIPIYKSRLSREVIDRIWKYIENSEIDFSKTLAGNITKSKKLIDEDDYLLKNVLNYPIKEMFDLSKTNFPWFRTPMSHNHEKLTLTSLWVNYQNQFEFNPLHNHAGVISFVIWLKIPTNWREQHNLPFTKNSRSPAASDFSFSYTNILGQIQDLPILMDKSSENYIVVFPAALRHQVYPFYNSEETRISVSGNVAFDSNLN